MDNDVLGDEPYGLDTLQDDEDYQAQQPGSGDGGFPGAGGGFPGGFPGEDTAGSGDIGDGVTTQIPDGSAPGEYSIYCFSAFHKAMAPVPMARMGS